MSSALSGLPISWATPAGEERERVDPFGLDRLGGGLTGFRGIVEHEHQAGTARSRAIQRADVQAEQPGPRVFHLELGPEHPVASRTVERGDVRPVEVWQVARHRFLLLGLRGDAQHARGHAVEVHDAPAVVGDEDARVDGVEEALQELPLLGQSLHDALEAAGVHAAEPPQGLVEESGFDPVAPVQSHRFCRK